MRAVVPVAVAIAVAATVAGDGGTQGRVAVTDRWRTVGTGQASADVADVYALAERHPESFLLVLSSRHQRDERVSLRVVLGADVSPAAWDEQVAAAARGHEYAFEQCEAPVSYYDRLAAEVAEPWPDGRRPWKRELVRDTPRDPCRVAVTLAYNAVPWEYVEHARRRWGDTVEVRSRPLASRAGDLVAPFGDVISNETLSGILNLPYDDPATFATVRAEGPVVVVLGPGADGVDWKSRVRDTVGPYAWRVHRCPYRHDDLDAITNPLYTITWEAGKRAMSVDFDIASCSVVVTRSAWSATDLATLDRVTGGKAHAVTGEVVREFGH